MYVLRNATGNVVRHTDSERKREELLRMGYTEVEEGKSTPPVSATPSQPPLGGGLGETTKKKAKKAEEVEA